MDPSFWVGFFGLMMAVVTAISAHLKNVQQDKAALKRDVRINTLEIEQRVCQEERTRLLEQIKWILVSKAGDTKPPP